MECRDFERLWNERIDAREAEMDGALEAHAASCAPCRALTARYQTLLHVLRAAGPPPAAPAEFADRFLRSLDRSRPLPLRNKRPWQAVLPVAVAAALLMVVLFNRRTEPPLAQRTKLPAPRGVKPIDPQSLSDALALARSATLDLARETSAPAARIGREVLGAASLPEAATLPLPESVPPSADVLQSVGDRVSAGVRPLSGTARHAFGFLFSPPEGGQVAPPPT